MSRVSDGTRTRRAAQGLAATLAFVALVVGVPVVLAMLVGWPLPHGVPRPSAVVDALRETYVPDDFLVKALAVVCWLAWAQLVVSLVVEIVARARGRQAESVRLTGPTQRLAAWMVAGTMLLVVALGTRDRPSVEVVDPPRPPDAAVVLAGAGEPAPPAPPVVLPTYQVVPRDTLWDISEAHLGDPFRWVEIWELNRDRPQPDGSAMVDPDLIYPGWVLQLPADAVGLNPPPAPAPPAPAGRSAPSGPNGGATAPSETEYMAVDDASPVDGRREERATADDR